MARIHRGRFSAALDDDFVVFLIGMRVNKPWKVGTWLPVARAMPAMQREVLSDPALGCLHVENFFGRTTLSVQYWRSFDDLDRYARVPEHLHLPAWRAFNRAVRDSGDVGIWHETYRVAAGQYECIYGNMPRFGLARAGEHHPAFAIGQTARRRVGISTTDEPAVEPY